MKLLSQNFNFSLLRLLFHFFFIPLRRNWKNHGFCEHHHYIIRCLISGILLFYIHYLSVFSITYVSYNIRRKVMYRWQMLSQHFSIFSNIFATSACKASCYQPWVTPWVIIIVRCTMRPVRAKAQHIHQSFALSGRVFPFNIQNPGRCPGL